MPCEMQPRTVATMVAAMPDAAAMALRNASRLHGVDGWRVLHHNTDDRAADEVRIRVVPRLLLHHITDLGANTARLALNPLNFGKTLALAPRCRLALPCS